MARRNRTDGGAHELIDQIVELSHRRVPLRRLAATHRSDTANIRYMRLAVDYARSGLEKAGEQAARAHALGVFEAQERSGHMCWPGDRPDAVGYRHRVEQMAAADRGATG